MKRCKTGGIVPKPKSKPGIKAVKGNKGRKAFYGIEIIGDCLGQLTPTVCAFNTLVGLSVWVQCGAEVFGSGWREVTNQDVAMMIATVKGFSSS